MAAAPPARPNILVILTDQQHAGMMSCAGDRHLRTPALDRLAEGGTRFERAYTTNPVCVPSRVSMMTGRMPSELGVRSNGDANKQASPEVIETSLGRLLRTAGYETVFGGKTHWIRGMTLESLGFRDLTRDERDGLAAEAVRFLGERRDRPFLMVASFINPHDICYMAIDDHARAQQRPAKNPERVVEREMLARALERPSGALLPPLPPNFEIPRLEPEAIDAEYARDFRDHARRTWTPEMWRLHRWAYRRLTEKVDAQIGRVMQALRDNHLEEQTVVIFTSDHGDMDGAHRLEHKGVLYEEATRVPFIVSHKGASRPRQVDRTHLVSAGLDLLPTVCDYAGITPPRGLLGRSVRPFVEGRKAQDWRSDVLVETQSGRMVRSDRYKLSVYERGARREQLIDLHKDPGEMTNLADDRSYERVLAEHRRRLERWVTLRN